MADKLGRINVVIRLDSPEGAYLTELKQTGITYAHAVRDALKIARKKRKPSE